MIETKEARSTWALALQDLVQWHDNIKKQNNDPAVDDYGLTIDLIETSEYLDCIRECINAEFITVANRRFYQERTSELPTIHLFIRFTRKGLDKVAELKLLQS